MILSFSHDDMIASLNLWASLLLSKKDVLDFNTYVIDERGLIYLCKTSVKYDIKCIRVYADLSTRIKRRQGTCREKMKVCLQYTKEQELFDVE